MGLYYSPLRYPGGKRKLARFIAAVCRVHGIDGHYVEPYAGGAAVGLELLFTEQIREITINDLDRSVYAFWRSVTRHPNKLCQKIRNTEVNLKNWKKAKEIQANKMHANILDLGFSTFFLNRTNYSGIINGGILGGINQDGPDKIDCRFNKDALIGRIMQIAKRSAQIHVHNKDAMELVEYLSDLHVENNMLYYFDPPYYSKGAYLYMNHYQKSDHQKISDIIKKITHAKWIVSYDNVSEITQYYSRYANRKYSPYHTARSSRIGNEIIFFSRNLSQVDKAIVKIPNRHGVVA